MMMDPSDVLEIPTMVVRIMALVVEMTVMVLVVEMAGVVERAVFPARVVLFSFSLVAVIEFVLRKKLYCSHFAVYNSRVGSTDLLCLDRWAGRGLKVLSLPLLTGSTNISFCCGCMVWSAFCLLMAITTSFSGDCRRLSR